MDSSNITPFIYQDLTSGGTGMMPYAGNPFMTGMYPTNLLGGVQFAAQPDSDKFMRMQERNEKEKNVFLKSMAALLIIGGSAALLFKGKLSVSKFFKNSKIAIATQFAKAGTKTKNGVASIGKGAASAGRSTKKGLGKVGHAIASPFKWVGRKLKNGTKKTGSAFSNGFKKVGRGIASPFKWVANKIKQK